MDLLEAFVLHDKIVVDNGSRSYDLWPSLPWLPSSLGAETPTGDGVLIERDLVEMTMPEAPWDTEEVIERVGRGTGGRCLRVNGDCWPRGQQRRFSSVGSWRAGCDPQQP